jgi:hypothetical protein
MSKTPLSIVHTPNDNLPWRIEHTGPGYSLGKYGHKTRVDAATHIEGRWYTVATNVSNNDAPLLVNAPHMLDALKECLRHVEHKDVGHALVDHDGDDDNLTLADMLKNVIAAAENKKL